MLLKVSILDLFIHVMPIGLVYPPDRSRLNHAYPVTLAPVFTLSTDLVVGSAPPKRAGAASAISETNAEIGGALGIAILGSVGAAVYRTEVIGAIPAGIPSESREVTRDTLGGAVSIAEQLPKELGSLLLDGAREAFIQSLHLTLIISVTVAAFAAILVFVVLRNMRIGSKENEKSSVINKKGSPDQ
jgi:MFS transporter, DHA2 family, multidrug resistance protein